MSTREEIRTKNSLCLPRESPSRFMNFIIYASSVIDTSNIANSIQRVQFELVATRGRIAERFGLKYLPC